MFQAVGDKIIVKPNDDSWKTSHEKYQGDIRVATPLMTGVIVAMGPGEWVDREYAPQDYDIGSHVFFSYFDQAIEFQGDVYLIVDDYGIVGVEV
jgi:co-chaperonin GroES (HSP10)